jgi:hypothetical protein
VFLLLRESSVLILGLERLFMGGNLLRSAEEREGLVMRLDFIYKMH